MELVSNIAYFNNSRFYSTVSLSNTIEPLKQKKSFVKKLQELRVNYVNSGGKIYTIEEINKELTEDEL
ncbi:MAG TPA: hypothetical protein PKX79_00070 [Spirochaetota bacterium]|nr:hypothetical protein [Spirochaetota bacterium]HOK92705.1 hypothetical protein [Spirochaetota bacterium]HPP93754.1 hypothetical protein [Spirochaetota bacterium]